MTSNALEFASRNCKQGLHPECHGTWTGLGFITRCSCLCHKKSDKALAGVVGPEANAVAVTSLSRGSSNEL